MGKDFYYYFSEPYGDEDDYVRKHELEIYVSRHNYYIPMCDSYEKQELVDTIIEMAKEMKNGKDLFAKAEALKVMAELLKILDESGQPKIWMTYD